MTCIFLLVTNEDQVPKYCCFVCFLTWIISLFFSRGHNACHFCECLPVLVHAFVHERARRDSFSSVLSNFLNFCCEPTSVVLVLCFSLLIKLYEFHEKLFRFNYSSSVYYSFLWQRQYSIPNAQNILEAMKPSHRSRIYWSAQGVHVNFLSHFKHLPTFFSILHHPSLLTFWTSQLGFQCFLAP